MAVSQILFLREQLNKPVASKEKFENRNQDSLMDTILDLTEELNSTKTNHVEEIKEAEEKNISDKKEEIVSNTITENNADKNIAESINKVSSDVLVNLEEDKLNNEKKLEKIGKEDIQESNNISVKNIDEIRKFYEI